MKKMERYKKYITDICENRDLFFLLLVFLAVFFKINKIYLTLGVEIDISNLFLILILLNFSFKRALIVGTIINGAYIILINGNLMECTYLLELIGVGLIRRIKPNTNIIFNVIVYWVIFGFPIFYTLINLKVGIDFKEVYYFRTLILTLTGVFNAYLADVLSIYIVNNKIRKRNTVVTFKQILLHIVTGAILIPFIINISVDMINSYEYIAIDAKESSDEILFIVEDELEKWDSKKLMNLQLGGVIEVGELKEVIKRASVHKPFNIYIKDNRNRDLIKIKNYNREFNKDENEVVYKYSNFIKKVTPSKEGQSFFINEWVSGYFLYESEIKDLNISIAIEIPIEVYKEKIISEYLSQFNFLMLFSLIFMIIATFINRAIFNSLYKVATLSKDLPNKIASNLKIDFPSSSISEVNLLSNNIAEMSENLKESFQKVTESQKLLYELAYYDSLTGLPNRHFLKEYLSTLEANNSDEKICVMFIDLNRFKIINDTLGHHVGDLLLKKVANRLSEVDINGGKIYRIGGDEFVVVASIEDEEEVKRIGLNIAKTFKDDFKLDEIVVNSSCSIGVSIYPDHSRDMVTILKYADISMYIAKDKGYGHLQIFNDNIKEYVLKKFAIEKEISQALARDEFKLYYQGKIDGKTGEVIGAEALIRWSSETLGVIPPDKFIPIAEESELIVEIDKWVILNACKEIKSIQDRGYKKIPVSINMSAKSFANRELYKVIINALTETKLEAKYLIVEITENVLIQNVEQVCEMIFKLNEVGVNISIDDFGKAYSSLNQLMNLPISEMKIDRDFIVDIDKNIKKQNIVKLIVELGKSLNLNIVAEGIEKEEEKCYLNKIGCNKMQGYLFSRPSLIEDFTKTLERKR